MLHALQGKESLSRVSLAYLAIPGVAILLTYVVLPVSSFSVIIISLAFIAWGLLSSVALWRCAFNTETHWLGYLARMTIAPVVLIVVSFIWVLFIGIHGLGS